MAPSVTITIGTLGFIESEMIKGKLLSPDGQISVRPELIKVRYVHCSFNLCLITTFLEMDLYVVNTNFRGIGFSFFF